MIRINLYPALPVKKKRKVGLVDFLVVLLIGIIYFATIWFVNGWINEKVEIQSRMNELKKMKIESIKQEIKDHDRIKKQLEEIEGREKIIQELIAARTGPVQMLVELMNILSAGKGPAIKPEVYREMLKQDPSSGFNPEWDNRRLWLTSFEESDKTVKIKGEAISNEDVGEFLRRLKISNYFYDEELVKTSSEQPSGTTAKIVSFELKCKIRYR